MYNIVYKKHDTVQLIGSNTRNLLFRKAQTKEL